MIKTPPTEDTRPLFTVIIPTKNRAEYLHDTLRTCTVQDYERLEVVVADDASTDNTREVVQAAASIDSRIRYTRADEAIGMRENFERALAQARPGFVIALGGDDGLLPGGIRSMLEALRQTGTDLLTWAAPVYRYPSEHCEGGQLTMVRRRGLRLIDSHEFLCRQAKNLHYLSDIECPMFYVKGVVSTSLVDQVRRRTPDGRFYSCPTPDGYSGIVLAGEVTRFAFSARPFSIYGLSPSSQGQAYLSNDQEAKRSSREFVRTVASRPMHPELASQPYSPLITLMTADYLLTARDLPGWAGAFPPIDYRQLLRHGIRELSNGLYGDERIHRELKILNHIAQQHGHGSYFADEVRRTPRRKTRTPFEGTGINASGILIDGATFRIRNIFDAAYVADCVYQAYVELTPATFLHTVARSIRYRFGTLGGKRPFPPPSEWK
jgi:glycosyltransferase involved in cell wall biosynthesis